VEVINVIAFLLLRMCPSRVSSSPAWRTRLPTSGGNETPTDSRIPFFCLDNFKAWTLLRPRSRLHAKRLVQDDRVADTVLHCAAK
jgi:hypothetical protein